MPAPVKRSRKAKNSGDVSDDECNTRVSTRRRQHEQNQLKEKISTENEILSQKLLSYPIYFALWSPIDNSIIILPNSSLNCIQPQSSTTTKQHENIDFNSQLSTLPCPLPQITGKDIIESHDLAFENDPLPESFIISMCKTGKGRIILALQFVPLSSCHDDDTSHSNTSGLLAEVEKCHNNDQEGEVQNKQLSNDINSYQTKDIIDGNNISYKPYIVGCIAGLHMQFWSRFLETEFCFQNILNIFAIWTADFARRRGIASQLFDCLLSTYIPNHIVVNEKNYFISYQEKNEQNIKTLSKTYNIPTSNQMIEKYFNIVQHSPNIEEISLEVRATNVAAQNLYFRKGFTKQREECNYYEHGRTSKDRMMHEMVVNYKDYKYDNA